MTAEQYAALRDYWHAFVRRRRVRVTSFDLLLDAARDI